MSASTLRDSVTARLTAFAWDQWAQLGVFAPTNRRDQTAADPEALLLFTFEVGRSDPRLFDEVLDWLLTNERLLSIQRLRNLCRDDDDRDLVEGALLWAARQQGRSRFAPPRRREQRIDEPRSLFYDVAQVREPDEAFLLQGLLKPTTPPSKKSQPPDPDTPISFAFRMRHLFGPGSRAEIVRYLITAPVTDASALGIADAAAYAKRNVNETLTSLVASRIVTAYEQGNERRYYLDRAMWGQFLRLQPNGWPMYRDWPRILGALRQVSRWLHHPAQDELTPYMLASNARTLMERLEPDLAPAGVAWAPAQYGEDYWDTFADTVERSLATLEQRWP
jgi:DNA-binding transcriptional ArsR family regulator